MPARSPSDRKEMKMEEEKEINRLIEKLDFYLKEKTPLHISLKDNSFWNGILIEKKNDGIYLFLEKKLGKRFLFTTDVYRVAELITQEDKK